MKQILLLSILILFSGCIEHPPKENRVEVMREDGYTDSCIYKVLATYGVSKYTIVGNSYKLRYLTQTEVLRIELDKCELELQLKEKHE